MNNLESTTQDYWNISSASRGLKSQTPGITTEKAITKIQNATNFLGPHRRVKNHLFQLLDRIIVGGKIKKGKQVAQVHKLQAISK